MKRIFVLAVSGLALVGCGGSDETSATGTFNLAFSDAPVDDLSRVCVAFDNITVKHSSEGEAGWGVTQFAATESSDSCIPDGLSIPEDAEGNPLFMVINLLEYQGESALQVLSDEEITAGNYTQMRLSVLEDGTYSDGTPYSHVVTDLGSVEGIRVPSGELKLDGFTVSENATQAYTLEFDLRKSMVLNANGYQLKPRGVRLVDNESVATISGTVEVGSQLCGGDLTHAYVYIYQETDIYGDLGSDNEPYTTAKIDVATRSFEVGYVPFDIYDIATLCNGNEDDPEVDDGLVIEPAYVSQQLTSSGLDLPL